MYEILSHEECCIKTCSFDSSKTYPKNIPNLTINRKTEQFSCGIFSSYPNSYIMKLFHKIPGLQNQTYTTQLTAVLSDCFGYSDFYSNGLNNQGWHAFDVITNCELLQKKWARDYQYNYQNVYQISIEQIKKMKPDVVYIHDLNTWGRAELLDAIKPHTQLIVGQVDYLLTAQSLDLQGFDIIFSSLPHYVEKFNQQGVLSYYQPLAFDGRVLTKIGTHYKNYPITFIGGFSQHHKNRIEFLEKIYQKVKFDIWGYGVDTIQGSSILKEKHHGEVCGLEMFKLMCQSQIVLNHHCDFVENDANNLRLFEATGCGALLITDYKDNLNDLFEVGKEVVAYRSSEECIDLIHYYMKHPREARLIAEAGQRRTLRDHSYMKRMGVLNEILKKHM
ncbi:MAG: hypothetical protein OMM_02244 [Candidatus Magnetoglobus multicellularis str. Araruama]|uniref:Spore protein YkvP/CgeB glycosyl transferase-like domain-containing protein n=1 Tax=Candidatus Magnetoglobus multicellularis str. Araruama TaxID=890399 RepID=A0A1V1PAF4_9BACT|nr:MAG: hypothetical protein OMM_02244 [Candidatus Magnetoglobus multicellularis str. Araruama]